MALRHWLRKSRFSWISVSEKGEEGAMLVIDLSLNQTVRCNRAWTMEDLPRNILRGR